MTNENETTLMNSKFLHLEVSLKDGNGNLVHNVPLKTRFSKEAVEELSFYHNVDIVEELTRTLFQELTHKYSEDDTTQLHEVLKELVLAGSNRTKTVNERLKNEEK